MADLYNDPSSLKEDEKDVMQDVDYPVEDISQSEPANSKNVKEAVEELNPTIDSLGKRG